MDNKVDVVNAISSISRVQPVSFFHGNTSKEKFQDKFLKEATKKNKNHLAENNLEKTFKSLAYLLHK